jgi:outer membrane protein OmpA-like peptidoglycan-associated protein
VAYSGAPLPSSDFPINRRGYDRDAVDGFVRSIQSRLNDLEGQTQRLIAENGQLRHDLTGAQDAAHPDFNNLGGRAQEILRVAEEQAGDLTAQAQRDIDDQVIPVLRSTVGTYLRVEGNTDSTGNPAANVSLSQKRAVAVQAYLEKAFNLPKERFQTQGHGANNPVASNATETGRQLNRRTDIKVILAAQ